MSPHQILTVHPAPVQRNPESPNVRLDAQGRFDLRDESLPPVESVRLNDSYASLRRCLEAAMPLFEYRCPACTREFEALVRTNETAECPDCGSKQVEKLLSMAAAHVGSGGSLPVTSACPPPSHGPCGPGCCRVPMN